MRIRIKVKHLVLLVAAVIVAVPLLRLAIYPGDRVLLADSEIRLPGSGSPSEEALIREMTDSPPAKRWSLIREKVIRTGNDSLFFSTYNVYVGSFSSWSMPETSDGGAPSFSTEEKIPLLDDYVRNGPVDDDYVSAVRQLSVCRLLQGRVDLALEALEAGRKRTEERLLPSALLNMLDVDRTKLLIQAGRLDDAEKLADELSGRKVEGDSGAQLLALQARLLLNKGDWQQAKERLEEIYDTRKELLGTKPTVPPSSEPSTDAKSSAVAESTSAPRPSWEDPELKGASYLIYIIEKAQASGAEKAAVYSGTVKRSNGQPVAGAGVFLRLASDVNHSVMSNEPYQTTTDADGRFSFIGVMPGSYQLGLGLSFDQVSGWVWPVEYDEWIEVKGGDRLEQDVVFQPLIQLDWPVNLQSITEPEIDFTWEPVPGADYYAVELGLQVEGGWAGTPAFPYIRDTHLKVRAEDLYNVKFGYSSSTEPNKKFTWTDIDPKSLLGFSDTDNQYYWAVKAYDTGGRLLAKSEGFRMGEANAGNLPQFYLREREMTVADRLAANRRYEEALAAYKADYAADPGDARSLNMILRLLESRNSFSDVKTGKEDILHYLELLTKLRPTTENLSSLASAYYEKRDWPGFNHTYERYLRIQQVDNSGYMAAIGALAYFKQNNLPEAESQFARSLAADKSHRFIGAYIAFALRADLSFDRATRLAEQYPDYGLTMSGASQYLWVELLQAMRQEAGDEKTYLTELATRMNDYLADKPERIREWQAPANRSSMKKFLERLLEVK